MEFSDRYMAYMGMAPQRIPHWEHWSCPDAETYLTGVDYYEHLRLCRLRMRALYPQLRLSILETDEPKPRPGLGLAHKSSSVDEDGRRHVRWGDKETLHWNWGERFHTAEDVLSFSPLAQGDFSNFPMVTSPTLRQSHASTRTAFSPAKGTTAF